MKLTSVTLLAASCLLASCHSPVNPVETVSAAGSLQSVAITDPANGMQAVTFQVPAGWHFAGTIARAPGCHSGGAAIKFTLQAPDGVTGFSQLPSVQWSSTSSQSMQRVLYQMNCPPVDIKTAADLLVNVAIPQLHEKATIVAILPPSAETARNLAAERQKTEQQLAQMAGAYGQQPPKVVIDGARVRVQYQAGGHPMEEIVSTQITCSDTMQPALMGQQPARSTSCYSKAIMVAHAPQGKLDALIQSDVYRTTGPTAHINPEWQNRLSQESRAAFQKQQADSAAAFRVTMQNGDAAGRQRMSNAEAYLANEKASYAQHNAQEANRRAVVSEGSHQISLYAADRADFTDPATGRQVEADGGYNHQWISADGGNLIQTNSPSYDPNGQTSINQTWTELVPQK